MPDSLTPTPLLSFVEKLAVAHESCCEDSLEQVDAAVDEDKSLKALLASREADLYHEFSLLLWDIHKRIQETEQGGKKQYKKPTLVILGGIQGDS